MKAERCLEARSNGQEDGFRGCYRPVDACGHDATIIMARIETGDSGGSRGRKKRHGCVLRTLEGVDPLSGCKKKRGGGEGEGCVLWRS